ncbi:hypothetical protein [Streptomyces sp. NPDC060001]|uniref:hypothetical protein n=1 Tax=Streptomyces sp. NPDC060001 TaxID=3347032 RepID=UPI00368F0930
MPGSIPLKINALERRLAQVQKGQRYAHGGSIENATLTVNDSAGSVRTIVGVQGDGTVGVQAVNGPPPPQPSAPIVAPDLGGVTVEWDGQFAGGAVIPMDWQRVEIHASIVAIYDPVPATLQSTIETAQGATVRIPCDTPVYVRLVARSASGTASPASATVGPFGPDPVVASDILDGIVTTLKLADEAVTAAKVAVGAIGADQLGLGIGNLAPDPSFEGPLTAAKIVGRPEFSLVTPGNNSATALHIDCNTGFTTWLNIEVCRYDVLPGERHFLAFDYKTSADFNGGAKLLFRYEDAAGAVTGYGVVDGLTVGGAYARATGQVQAPPNTVAAFLLVEAGSVSVGEAWFDNIEVRTLIAGGMVAAGTITATEIAALTINAGNIAADAIVAAKIAANAVTTAKLDALAVTTAKIDANAITVGKIDAGAVDATALAADAITGKTITGGLITGTEIQTAASGERVTINEAGANKVLIYNSAGTAIGELSDRGLLLEGNNGALLYLDPDSTYPNLRFTNDDQSNEAVINVVENAPGSANLGLNSGTFTGSTFADMKWRHFIGEDFAVIERLRDSNNATVIGGRLDLRATYAALAYHDSTAATQYADLVVTPGEAKARGKFTVQPYVGDSGSVVFIQPGPGHTGYMIRCWDPDASQYKFTVDQAGNVLVKGTLTAGNVATGSVTITPSAAHTPTSALVTFNVTGSTFRGFATANTTVPGVRTPAGSQGVTGVSVSSVTATSMLVWVNRENTTATTVNWRVEAV